MNHTHTMLKGTLILTLSGFLTKIIGFLYRIFLSQTIGSTGMGIYQLIFPIHALCFALTVGGIQTAISRLVAAKFAKKEDSDARAVFLIATSFSTLLSILVTFFLFHYADWFAIHILFEPQCTSLLKVSSLSIPMGTFHSCVNGYYFARKKTLLPALSQLIEQTARVAASYLLWLVWSQEGHAITPMLAVFGLFFGEFISMLFALFITIMDFHSSTQPVLKIIKPFRQLKEILAFSTPLTCNRLLVNLLHSIESILIPGHLCLFGMTQQTALSVYGVLNGMALPLILFPCAITNAVSVMLLPSVAEHQALGNYDNIRLCIQKTICYCLILGFLFTFGFFFLADFLGLFLFKNELASTFIRTLSFICPCLYLSSTLSGILNGLGQTGPYFFQNMTGLSIRLLFVFFVIPTHGIIGYLWGLLLSELITTFLTLLFLHLFLKGKCL